MPWRIITAANMQGRFTASEQAMLVAASGSTNKLMERINDACKTFVGALNATDWDTLSDGSVPDQLRNTVMDYAVWEWLKDFPQLDKFKTKERSKAYDDAVTVLGKIANRTFGAVESPLGVDKTTANWNSKGKLMMRTDPHPLPQFQLQQSTSATPIYANPNAPRDEVPTNSPDVPQPPLAVRALAANGSILVYWNPVTGAEGYQLFKSATAGFNIDSMTPTVELTTETNWTDTDIVAGVQVFYKLATKLGALVSGASNEASATL